jgi:hypothetical protein
LKTEGVGDGAWGRAHSRSQVGKGTIGKEAFRVLLNDLRLAHAAFIAETPIENPGNVQKRGSPEETG